MNDVKINLGKIFLIISYVAMLAVNIGANCFLLNGTTTGEVTTDLQLTFQPAGFTFSIWGLIYFLQFLSMFAYFRWNPALFDANEKKDLIGLLFGSGAVCLLNLGWIITWHHYLWSSTVVILVSMFLILAWINFTLDHFSRAELDFVIIKVSNRIYFAWVTIAAILNLVITLIREKVIGSEISEVTLTIGILVLSCFLGLGFLLCLNSISYGAVYLWAYLGILSNHLSQNGWSGFADSIVFTVCIAMMVIAAGMCLVIYRKQKSKNSKE